MNSKDGFEFKQEYQSAIVLETRIYEITGTKEMLDEFERVINKLEDDRSKEIPTK
jgi:hypothetical protein